MANIITYSGVLGGLLSVIVLLIAIVLSVRLSRIHRLVSLEKQANIKLYEKSQKIQKQHEELLNELMMATRGISEKVITLQNIESPDFIDKEDFNDLKEQVVEMASKMQSLESSDPTSRLYSTASKLVASGATIEEIMDECDLPRAEAELMMNLHSKG